MPTIVETCACENCTCQVDHQDSGTVQIGDEYFCSKQCAQGHHDYPGCGHNNCTCYSHRAVEGQEMSKFL